MSLYTARVAKRRGVVVQSDEGQIHVITGVDLQDGISLGDTVELHMESGPWTNDFIAKCKVVGVVAKVTADKEPDYME